VNLVLESCAPLHRNEVGCVCEGTFLPPILWKQNRPLNYSNNWLHSCRPLIAEKHGTNNWQELSWALLTVWYDIHMSIQLMRQPNLGPTKLETK
jgi:hypothetical protein